MDNVKFRGITDKNRIVYGGFSVHATDGKIMQDKNEIALAGKVVKYEQYTGKKDRNEKEAYEGDKVKLWYEECFFQGEISGIIDWSEIDACFVIEFDDCTLLISSFDVSYSMLEVIGNIHENLEELKP